MSVVLVTGVGFTPSAIIEVARRVEATTVVAIVSHHPDALRTLRAAKESLPEVIWQTRAVDDWQTDEFYAALRAEILPLYARALASDRECRFLVNLSAGHALMHFCLGHFAAKLRWECVYIERQTGALHRFQPSVVLRDPLPEAARTLGALLVGHPMTPKEIVLVSGRSQSTVYDALRSLDELGLLRRYPRGRATAYEIDPSRASDLLHMTPAE